MAIQKTEAIIIKTQPFRSSSLIVSFFTRQYGKIRCLAKGVRLERETRGAVFELFSYLDIVYYEKQKSDLHLLSEGALMDSYDGLHARLDCIVHASYFAELVEVLTEIHDPSEEIFNLLDFSFRFLPSLPGPKLVRLFEIKLMHAIGWLPHLEGCISCQKIVPEKGFFSARQGALICEKCKPKYTDAIAIGRDALAAMRYFVQHELDSAIKFPLSRHTEIELQAIMDRFLLERVHHMFKSRLFLEKIKPALVIS